MYNGLGLFGAPPAPERPKKNVSFSSVEVRAYDRTIDWNPAVTSSIAVGLDWTWQVSLTLDLGLRT